MTAEWTSCKVLLPAKVLAACLLLQSGSASAAARDRNDEQAVIADCIRRAAGKRQWIERTLLGLRDQEAGWVGAEVRNRDGSHDLGPLQINSRWIPRLARVTGRNASSIRWWLIHDACFNVQAARWIFLSGLGTTRNYWRAVELYHSPTKWRGRRYAALVARRMHRRFGAAVFADPAR